MTTIEHETTPVLIVGGSLVGLSAALFLAWQGVPVVLVERHTGSAVHPRAIGYTTRTLELFRTVGITLPPSVMGPPRRARVESLAGTWHEEYPWTEHTGDSNIDYSPAQATAIPQDQLEPILRARAAELGADLRLGTELISFSQDDGGVLATLRRVDGSQYPLRAQYMVSADGAASPVREALGIQRSGQGLLSVQRSILFRAPLDQYLERGVVQFEITQPDLQAFLTTYADGRWVLMLSDDRELSVCPTARRDPTGSRHQGPAHRDRHNRQVGAGRADRRPLQQGAGLPRRRTPPISCRRIEAATAPTPGSTTRTIWPGSSPQCWRESRGPSCWRPMTPNADPSRCCATSRSSPAPTSRSTSKGRRPIPR